jgi:uncharacterized membrane protein YidH (DUF202 family)
VSPDEDPDGPPGTARLRTRLSWRRTALSATGVLLLTLRAALRLDNPPARAAIMALSVLGWLGLLVLCQSRMAAMSGSPPGPAGRTPAAMSLGIAGFAVLGIAAAVLL